MTSSAPPIPAVDPTRPGPGPWRPGVALAALVGVIAVGLAVGIAELLAAFGGWIGVFDAPASPLTSLGQSFIQLTPEWLKEFAIRTFGQNDKTALAVGMGVTLVVVAAAIGIVARRSPRVAVGITVALIVVAAVAILTRAGSGIVDLIPLLVGGAVGVVFLVTVFRRQVVSQGRNTTTSAVTAAGPDEGSTAPSAAWDEDQNLLAVQSKGAKGETDPENPKAATSGAAHPMSAGTRTAVRAGTAPGTVDRRQFFRLAAIGAAAAAVAGALARWIPSTAEVTASRSAVSLPVPTDVQQVGDVALQVPGITPFVVDNADFYRVDTAFVPPRVTTDIWELRLRGMVDNPITLTYADLTAMPSIERMITLTCVSNEVGGDLAGNARWQGVRIADVLAMAKPQAGADCVLSTSFDGFTVTTPLEALTDSRDALLAFAMNGEPLPIEHGFPVRMVVPGLYGYVSATKWVVELDVTKFSEATAYWTDRGWAPQAPIKTASRIDVPAGFAQLSKGSTVAVAGVAWAQHRGISAVQVQIDDGDWQDATLSGEVSADTWRQWAYQWDATESGTHTLRCRAIDGNGDVQTDQVQGVMPDGATGWDSRQVTVTA
ncbi:MAG TPA: molybdopterin-dependent oxidoreductase [Nakamurella sp.]|nr:molybdopterin-dependent oxidoreductase [Nakamurella sp.]